MRSAPPRAAKVWRDRSFMNIIRQSVSTTVTAQFIPIAHSGIISIFSISSVKVKEIVGKVNESAGYNRHSLPGPSIREARSAVRRSYRGSLFPFAHFLEQGRIDVAVARGVLVKIILMIKLSGVEIEERGRPPRGRKDGQSPRNTLPPDISSSSSSFLIYNINL